MKNLLQLISKVTTILLMVMVPVVVFSQAKEPAKSETTKTSKCEKAPSHSFWSITGYGSLNQFNGDLSKNILFNDKWMFGAGGKISKQFSRVVGVGFRGGWVPCPLLYPTNFYRRQKKRMKPMATA